MRVVVGRVGRAHGIRGDLAIELRTDEPEKRFALGSSVFCRHGELKVAHARPHSGRWLVGFEQIPDRTAAEQHHGCVLEADIDPDEQSDDGYYDHQLRGLDVVVGGSVRGRVLDVLHLPSQDSLLLDIDGTHVQVPFVEALVPIVDLENGLVTVVDRPGLLDPDEAQEAR